MQTVTTIGLDIAKSVFHIHGVDAEGKVRHVGRQRRRGKKDGAIGVSTRLVAEALSRPAVVRAATQVSRAATAGNPVATRRALALLGQVASREGLISAAGMLPQNPLPASRPQP